MTKKKKKTQQQHRLAIIHLQSSGERSNSSNVKAVELAAWVPPAAVTCTAAAQIPSSSSSSATTLLAAGCADGSLCRLRVSFPRTPGATIAETKLNEDDFDVADLVPWRERLHSGAVTSVAVSSSSGGSGGGGGEPSPSAVVATSGSDGSIVLTPLEGSSSSSISRVLVPARPAASISAIAWASGGGPEAGLLAACGSAAPVELFDVRSQSGRPVARAAVSSPSSVSSSDASLLCVHPARPNLAATAGRKGIALWDLRFLGKGAAASLGGEKTSPPSSFSSSSSFSPLLKGGVTGLAFDPLPSVGLSEQAPRLLFSTGDGVVGSARMVPGGGGGAAAAASGDATLLYREAGASALALAVEPSSSSSDSSSSSLSGREIFVSTDQECLIYMQRPLV